MRGVANRGEANQRANRARGVAKMGRGQQRGCPGSGACPRLGACPQPGGRVPSAGGMSSRSPSNSRGGAVYKHCPRSGPARPPRSAGRAPPQVRPRRGHLRGSLITPPTPPQGHPSEPQPRPAGGPCREGPAVRGSAAGGPLPAGCVRGFGAHAL
ncbi:basic proline-rich protein-like [Pipra filicauda]|uniref:Basic proline-rich protein-like n=1 Tax=Pipra filicauda TaxID=649802 RepID=A0A7R5KBY6_9PASS|nr:basic proline-rich protein-like [Pipra filicauda]